MSADAAVEGAAVEGAVVGARYRHLHRWSDDAIARLRNAHSCPVCGGQGFVHLRCPRCGSDFTGATGAELWEASEAAASALEARQAVLERVPQTAKKPPRSRPAMAAAPIAPVGDSAASKTTVQSVLAVAGAALVAIAALVFTFFTPDLTDRGARSAIIGGITVLFLIGAGMLSRRRLRFSAEAVGGLGMVFLGLDVWTFLALTPAGVSEWVFAAMGTLAAGAALLALATASRIRVWLWGSLLALAFVPMMLGAASEAVFGGVIGWLAAAGAALALIGTADRLAARFTGGVAAERVTLTVALFAFVAGALLQMWALSFTGVGTFWLALSAVLLIVMIVSIASTTHPARMVWSATAGVSGVAAFAVLPLGLWPRYVVDEWYLALLPTAAVIGLIALAALSPMPRSVNRAAFVGGAVTAVIASAWALSGPGIYLTIASVAGILRPDQLAEWTVAAIVLGLCALAIGLTIFARLHTRRYPAMNYRWLVQLGEWFAVLAAIALISAPAITAAGRITIALGLAIAASAALIAIPRIRDAGASTRTPLIAGAHIAVLLAAVASWHSLAEDGAALTIGTGVAVVATTVILARTVAVPARFLHVAAGYSYALVVLAFTLGQSSIGPVAVLCLTTSIGGVTAIIATFTRWIAPRNWYAILVVTAVPFALAVLQVVALRSGWTAVSTTVIFLLALTLVITRRAGLGVLVRGLAAGVLVPSLAVVAVCLGAELLETSGSPVVLPMIAVIVAVVLPATRWGGELLLPRIGQREAATARLAVEASTLVTAAIAVLLSLTRDAAGLWTTLLVLVIVGIGSAATAVWAGRRYGWGLAGAAFTGALWCVWALVGVSTVEAYVLPPALGAAVIGAVLTGRGVRAVPLYSAGLLAAVVPTLALLVGEPEPAPWRGFALVAASWILVFFVFRFRPGNPLRPPTSAVAVIAGMAGAVQGVRWGWGLDARPDIALPLVVMCLAIGVAGALPAGLAARSMHRHAGEGSALRRTRWLYAPALVAVAVATWPAIERDWFTIWTMWALMLGYLGVMVVTAARSIVRGTSLPPVWFTFGIAFATAIVAWSPRDLRVEWFSLPLGAFLLAAGALALRTPVAQEAPRGTLSSWPARWRGSWALLTPGIVVMMSASIAATYTDPLTWRAILVIVLALIAILIGASAKLAAPFVIGIIVLPVENIFVFLVQIGRDIQAMPWWITLAVVGAVLLIIAVTYERRADGEAGIAARLRDLA